MCLVKTKRLNIIKCILEVEVIFCPQLKIHGYYMERVQEVTYLVDIVRAYGKNSSTITELERAWGYYEYLGYNHLWCILLPEFFTIKRSILCEWNQPKVKVWYGLNDSDIQELDDLDRELIQRAFGCPFSVLAEAGHLELGLVPIHCIVKELGLSVQIWITLRTEGQQS